MPAVIRPGSACSSRPEPEELSSRRARARLPPVAAAGAWLAGGDAAGVAGAGAFGRAEQLKPRLSCGVSANPCSEIPAEQEKPCLGTKAQRGEARGAKLCYPPPAEAADGDNRAELLPEPPLPCRTPPGRCRAGIPIPHPESEEEIHRRDGRGAVL